MEKMYSTGKMWIGDHKLHWNTAFVDCIPNSSDFIETILAANGVENIHSFLHPTVNDCFDPFLFRDMDKAVELVHCVFENTDRTTPVKVFIKVDPDTDGYTSAALTYKFFEALGADITFMLSEGKFHGIKHTDVTEQYDLIVIPDAGSQDIMALKGIKARYPSTDILILDHHNYDDETIRDLAVLVNCQDKSYPNNTLSGVGVVYKFIEAYSKTYDIRFEQDKYLDLVAVGMIADSMDMRNPETRFYTLRGLEEIHNDFFKELIQQLEYTIHNKINIKTVGWNIAPIINAMVRYGKEDEKRDTFRALIGEQEIREYQPRRKCKDDPKPPVEYHTLQKTMARVCCNAKSRQDADVKRTVEKLIQIITDNGLDKNSVIAVNGTEYLEADTITGLIANKLMSKYKKPVIIYRNYSKDLYGGSARGYGKGELTDFRTFLNGTGLFEKCAGHANAFGVTFERDKVEDILAYCNAHIDNSDLVDLYEVDYEISADNLTEKTVELVANSENLWGNGVKEPVFAITDICVNTKDITGYKNENTDYVGFIEFKYNGVKYVKKYCKKTDYEEMICKEKIGFGNKDKDVCLNVIGTFEYVETSEGTVAEVFVKDFESMGVQISGAISPTAKKKPNYTDPDADDFIF